MQMRWQISSTALPAQTFEGDVMVASEHPGLMKLGA